MASLPIRLGVGAAALGLALATHASLPAPTRAEQAASDPPRPGAVRLASFGFDGLAADFWWLRAVQLVGQEGTDLGASAPLIGRLIELVVALDPFVDHPYRFASLWLVHSPSQVREANRILERGVAYHPLDWRDRFYLSFNHFFYLGDSASAARELAPAIALPGAPDYLGRLHARLVSERDGLAAAAAYLEELVAQTDEGFRRAEYEKALDEIETERRARVLDAAREEFRAREGRDIARVEELVEGPHAVLAALPAELHGFEWMLDPQTGAIESSYYKRRYELNVQDADRARRERWTREEASR